MCAINSPVVVLSSSTTTRDFTHFDKTSSIHLCAFVFALRFALFLYFPFHPLLSCVSSKDFKSFFRTMWSHSYPTYARQTVDSSHMRPTVRSRVKREGVSKPDRFLLVSNAFGTMVCTRRPLLLSFFLLPLPAHSFRPLPPSSFPLHLPPTSSLHLPPFSSPHLPPSSSSFVTLENL